MNEKKFHLHPIQLRDVIVNELNGLVRDSEAARGYRGDVTIKTRMANTPYQEGSSFVGVQVEVDIHADVDGKDVEPCFEISVKLEGHFEIDITQFKPEFIDEWARVNAVFLVMPFVRENAYGLAVKLGIHGLVFPLYIIPRLPSKGPVENK